MPVKYCGNKVGDRPPGGRVGGSRLVPRNDFTTDLANRVPIGNAQTSTGRRVWRRHRPEDGGPPSNFNEMRKISFVPGTT